MTSIVQRVKSQSSDDRQRSIVEIFVSSYSDLIRADPAAWRGKFRKMAATPFAFYRGSAALFYADMAVEEDPFSNAQTSRVWIQGDLHAANFGTYMNSEGVLVFDVNDFDEAYVGPFTWDIKRLVASLVLLGYEKALSDDEIGRTIETVVRSYVKQVALFAGEVSDRGFALTMANTEGKLLEVIRSARLRTRWELLERFTKVEDYERSFTLDRQTSAVDPETRRKVEAAFAEYLQTIPPGKRFGGVSYNIKDVVLRKGMGIGSAGLPSYNVLVEGPTQALENDIVVYMKQAATAAPSRAIADQQIKDYFIHDGHRTVISQRALQAYADPWLGYATLNGFGQLVAEASPYVSDLEWEDINDLDDILQVLAYLGQATAKIHCVSDVDSDQTLVPFSTDQAINDVLAGHEDEFVAEMKEFGQGYGSIVRDDYRLFVDAFRNRLFPGL
jgi:uncharacterized protein (DUF2252 family)